MAKHYCNSVQQSYVRRASRWATVALGMTILEQLQMNAVTQVRRTLAFHRQPWPKSELHRQ